MSRWRVETSIEIRAPAEQVWQELMDFQSFHEWNPLFTLIEGDMRIGGRLVETINLFGGRPVRWASRIIHLEPPHKFAWRGHVWFKQFGEGEHHYQVTPLSDQHCRFDHWEYFFGIVPNLLGPVFTYVAKKKFEAMNQAMKMRVEGKRMGLR
ncbi:MAG: SRPBCC domain-containing protein [Oligoflexia bacterium]|nr:SRPBCC domain-containing protein [Oligoflexia bacterium]